MLRSKMIRAAIPKGNPISFVDATGGAGAYGSTGTITISSTDFMVLFSQGKIADDFTIGAYTFGGTSSVNTPSEFISQGESVGDSGNDYLNIAATMTASSGGTLNMTEGGGRDAGYGIVALDGGDSVSYSFGGSVSNVTTDDVIVIYETTQTLGTATGVLPATPSGYTSAFSHTWTVGKGGGSQGWGSRVSYKTGQSGTVSHSAPTGSWDYIGSAIIRIYNA